ncbi:murein biosynthesis integral membrane protein MurJ [Thiohalocapsa marina]|uniref:Probable lipid II flippase MurJ n=1 Tax=Thiohalocapsa marina TaxID=424902 RepID=A0A5M8FMU0_9GAMM|nr:murein biosynthesis integral membrane protein MurJ [Thiohalocapsa marina]KAA6186057.1 murein biosynthesis integral membrane protein MurJ [Thiohalocapsa marina]
MTALAAAAAKVGGNTLLSRLLGFARDLVIARLFGADVATDTFFVAFRLPNLMRRLFAEGAFSAALVPTLTAHREQHGEAGLRLLLQGLAGTLGALLLLLSALGALAAPLLVLVFAPGFADQAEARLLATDMLRLVMPYLIFVGLTALAGSVLNTYERFGVPAFTPALLNLVLIACALWLSPQLQQPVLALAWGVLLGGVAQLAFQLPFLARLGLLCRPRPAPRDPQVRSIGRRLLPALFGISVTQLGLLIDTLLASFLVSGSISWLYYSERLVEFPLGILGVALGTVILPRLSRRHATGLTADQSAGQAIEDADPAGRTLDWALRWVVLLGFPAAMGLAVLAEPILAILFQSAAFGAADVQMAGRSLAAYALGLVGFMAIKVLVPVLYARHDLKTPVRLGVVALVLNLGLSLVLMGPLGHVGLALATAIATTVNAALLLGVLVRRRLYRPQGGWVRLLLQGVMATLIMGLAIGLGSGPAADWMAPGEAAGVGRLVLLIGGGVLVYGASLLVLGLRPRQLMQS